MSEVEPFLYELDRLLAEFRETLNRVVNFDLDDRQAKLGRCRRCIHEIDSAKQAAILEGRRIRDPHEKASVEQAIKKRMEMYRELVEVYETKKGEIDRVQLQAAEDEEIAAGGVRGQIPQDQTHLLIQRGDAVQNATQSAITNMQRMVGEAEQVGGETAIQMDNQIEQMRAIQEGLDDVQYNTKRARQTAAQMARGAAGDLCIQILCGGIALSTIAIIILSSV